MSDNWVVQNLQNALDTWNKYLTEIWQLIAQSPAEFKGGAIWGVILNIHDAIRAVGLALLVLSVEPEDAALLVLPPPPQPLRMPVTSMAADRRTAKVFFFIIQYLSCFVNLRFIMC